MRASLWALPVLGGQLGWGGHCGQAERPLCPAAVGRRTPGLEGTVRRRSFLYEGWGTERRRRPSLPQVLDRAEQGAAGAWGAGALSQAPARPSAPAAPCFPPSPFGSPSDCGFSSPEVGGMGLWLFPQRSVEVSRDFNQDNDNNSTR